jgi:ubiquinone/menaquinone biosynthesis C-methylase UbiE
MDTSSNTKNFQIDKWNKGAKGYNKWHDFLEDEFSKVSIRITELIRKSSNPILDIATGYGEPAITIAKLLPCSKVFAIDKSPQMLTIAKEKSKIYELNNIEFIEADITETHLHKNCYGSIVSRWGIMLFPNLDFILKKVYKSLVKGGKFVAVVWGQKEKVPLLNIPQTVLGSYDLERFGVKTCCESNGPFSLSNIDKLKEQFSKIGFINLYVEKIILTIKINSLEQYIEGVKELDINPLLSNIDYNTKESIIKNLKEKVSKYKDNKTGLITLENEAILISGIK